MKFIAENLGPIKKAEVDLSKKLILFTGQNNTGKTYLANAVYEMVETLLIEEIKDILGEKLDFNQNHYNIDLESIISDFSTKKYIDNSNYSLIVNKDFKKTLKDKIKKLSISREFLFPKIRISSTKLEGTTKLEIIVNTLNNKSEDDIFYLVEFSIEDLFFDIFINILIGNMCFLPAERSGIIIFTKELRTTELAFKNLIFDENLLKSKQELQNIKERRLFRYRKSIQNFIDFIENLDATGKKDGQYGKLADELESTILKGKVFIDDIGQIKYKDKKMRDAIDLNRASSTVHSLSSLALYLRYEAKEGDTIMIDEPELNLHLDNQILIARFLGRLVNEGFRVIVSTHSDFIVKEINNLIMLSNEFKGKDKFIKRYNYTGKEFINADKVQALLFKYGNDEPKNLPINKEGISVETMDDAIGNLDSANDNIYYEVFRKDE